MNVSVTHVTSALPKHCIGANGSIRRDLLRPAAKEVREAMTPNDLNQEASEKEEGVARLANLHSIEMVTQSKHLSQSTLSQFAVRCEEGSEMNSAVPPNEATQ